MFHHGSLLVSRCPGNLDAIINNPPTGNLDAEYCPCQDHSQGTIIKAQLREEENLEVFFEQFRQQLAVVFETDVQQNRDAEDELSMRDGIEDVVGDLFSERNRFIGMATPDRGRGQARAKPAALA